MLLLAFLFSGLLTFGLVVFVFRPTSEEKAVNRRIVSVKSAQSGGATPSTEDAVQQYLKTGQRSRFVALDERIEGMPLQKTVQRMIAQADQATTPGTVLVKCLGFAVVAALIADWTLGNLLITAGVAAASGYLPILMLIVKRKRRLNAFNEALPDCIDMMGRALRAGHSLVAAIDIVAQQAAEPAKTEFGEVFRKQNYGLPLREALMQLLERVPSQDLRVLVTGVLVQKDTGGNLAEILDRILHVIKDRMRVHGEIRTHTAQGRMTGWVLCILPVVMLALINMVNPGYSRLLFTDPLGKELLYAGVGLLCLGGFTIRAIVKGIEV